MNFTKEERELLLIDGWVIATDSSGNEVPYIYIPDDYDGCFAEGEGPIRRVIEVMKERQNHERRSN